MHILVAHTKGKKRMHRYAFTNRKNCMLKFEENKIFHFCSFLCFSCSLLFSRAVFIIVLGSVLGENFRFRISCKRVLQDGNMRERRLDMMALNLMASIMIY